MARAFDGICFTADVLGKLVTRNPSVFLPRWHPMTASKRSPNFFSKRRMGKALLSLCCTGYFAAAYAWSLTVTPDDPRLFLHVGEGRVSGASGTLNGTPGPGGRVNLVQVNVPVAQLGNGAALAMTSDSTQSTSLYGDGFRTCPNPASQVMVGAGYRRNGNGNGLAGARLAVSAESDLRNANGDIIPITEISWTVSAPAGGNANVIPAGNFRVGERLLATVPANRYLENCHTFFYANSAIRAAGIYNARVRYTLIAP